MALWKSACRLAGSNLLAMNPAAGSLAYNSSALTVCTMFVVWFCVQGFVRSTTKYWVRAEDVSVVKYHILQVRGHSTTQHDTLRGTACIQHSIAQHSPSFCFAFFCCRLVNDRTSYKGVEIDVASGVIVRKRRSKHQCVLVCLCPSLLQHLPVFQFDKDDFAGDAQLINSVYFDNENLELYHGRLDKKPNAIAARIR